MSELGVRKQIDVAGFSNFEHKILPLRERADVRDRWLKLRLETVLPRIMAREGFDMWIVIAREYNEDPVTMTLLPARMLSARRRTILVFTRKEDGTVERLSLARPVPALEVYYKGVWTDKSLTQHECLAAVVKERDPKTIGINISNTFAFGDGLTKGEYDLLADALGEKYVSRFKGAERLCLGWLEYRTPDEIATYVGINEIAHGLIREAFSSRVVLPGVTTANDVAWWIRQRINSLGLKSWFMPSIDIQRHGCKSVDSDTIIMPGDVLHCDIGIVYLGLCTDTQQNAYVLKLGENEVPKGLVDALATGNRLQDIHAMHMKTGHSGNQILRGALDQAQSEGIIPSIYSHPIGYNGHGAGPTIGLWDHQEGVPGRGDYELFENTAYAMELNIVKTIPEWDDQLVRIALEQTIIYTDSQVHFMSGRQVNWHIIR